MNGVLSELYQTILSRKDTPAENSYTGYLFSQGVDKICKKVGEECAEVIIAAKNNDPEAIINEAADVLYHLLVLLAERGISWDDAENELEARSRKIGNKKEEKNADRNT
jgi:phosphoribosyl-ATP pyrophosphohydrolase